jgi:pimeloyl-ACP methyl ester carboxylesterase
MAVSAPGQLIDVGGFRLHLHCCGQGSPTVVMDSALGGSSVSWLLVQPHIAELTRVCSYDRAGFGWSDRGPMPRTAGRIADELRVLLERANVPPPYVVVGHSFGGLVMRIFAARYQSDVAGMVLVDPAHPEDWVRPAPKEQLKIDRGLRLCRHGATAARHGVARIVSALATVGAFGLARGIARVVSGGRLHREDEGILAPVLDASAKGYGDLPLTTISSTDPGEYRLRQQDALAALSTQGRHVIATNSGHWIPLDEPATVIDAIRTVLRQCGVRAA